jgi:hypothetical protein
MFSNNDLLCVFAHRTAGFHKLCRCFVALNNDRKKNLTT